MKMEQHFLYPVVKDVYILHAKVVQAVDPAVLQTFAAELREILEGLSLPVERDQTTSLILSIIGVLSHNVLKVCQLSRQLEETMNDFMEDLDRRLHRTLLDSSTPRAIRSLPPSLSPASHSSYYSSSDDEESDGDDADDSYDSDESDVSYRRTPTPPRRYRATVAKRSRAPPPPKRPRADTGIKRSRKNHPRDKVKVLTEWIEEHRENPYPTEDEKAELCARLDMPKTQLNSWFINGEYRHKSRE
ncbi:hypothetical protein HK104_010178 [Borealophlyctis nickersoniae]|nr:hypothetical protein HK104_010178 [Borealophlyctis nickersoniae]